MSNTSINEPESKVGNQPNKKVEVSSAKDKSGNKALIELVRNNTRVHPPYIAPTHFLLMV